MRHLSDESGSLSELDPAETESCVHRHSFAILHLCFPPDRQWWLALYPFQANSWLTLSWLSKKFFTSRPMILMPSSVSSVMAMVL